MAQELEQILGKLLLPDTEKIKEGTAQLKVLVNDPGIVPVLCTVLGSSQNPQIRQYAAILLKNRLKSKKHWQSLEATLTQTIRQNILQVLLQEPEKSVAKAICQLISVVAKHDLPEGKWPQIFQFLQTYITSQDPQQREVGMFVLHTLASRCGEQLQPHFGSLLTLCSTTLTDKESQKVPFYTIQTLTEMVPMLGSDELKPFQSQVPKILEVITSLVAQDEDQATEALEIFDELVESEVSVIVPHIKSIIEFCLQIGANQDLGDPLRVKALSFVMLIAKEKRKSIIKLKLTVPILNVLFPILCQMPSEDEQDEDFDEAESHSPSSVAGQVIDVMALNLPPEKFIQPLSRLIDSGLASQDPNHRRAAYTAMAVASEGSADHIMRKLLKSWLQVVYKGLQDPEPMVRNAALFALGQFSEHLQPDISKYSAELLPILFTYLGTATENIDKDPRGVTKTFYALEMFVENLGKDILPHLHQLMDYLLRSISSSPNYRAKELAISALAATANAAQKEIIPYFQHIVELFKSFLQPTEDEHELKVQVQALDTLGVLARTMKEHFEPLAVECVTVGLTLLDNATDPDLRRCIYGLFAALSTILKEDMTKYLEVMVRNMITSVKSTEGVTAHYDHEESQLFNIFEEENIEEEEQNDDVEGFSVENAFMCEKEDACTSLGEIAVNTGVGFMLYMEECYKEVSDLHDYPAADVRTSAVAGVSNFCQAVGAVAKNTNSVEAQTALYSMLSTTVPKFLMIVKQDKDRDVVIETLEELKNMVEKIGAPVLQGENMLDNWMNIVREVIHRKTCCQDAAEESAADDEDDDEAELDSMLVENAGELLPAVAKVVGGPVFSPYFAGFLPELLKKTKKMNSVADRSFAIGTMADTIDALGPASSAFVSHLYPVFTNMIRDEDEEVRSNSVYALGVLAANGGDPVYSFYPQILKNLFEVMSKETYDRCQDNICATVCRLVMTRIQDVPMTQVFPVVMQKLPLKDDFEEYKTVFTCLSKLYSEGHPEMEKCVPQVISVIAQIVDDDKIPEETRPLITGLLHQIYQKQPDLVTSVCGSIPQDNAQKLQLALQQVINGTTS